MTVARTGGDHPTRTAPDWHRLEAGEVLERLGVSPEGLDDAEVARRLDEHGPNRLGEQEGVSRWRVLGNQFTSPLVHVLLGALVLTIVIQHYADAIVVGIVLVVNGTIGFVQEYRAETAVRSLMEMVSPHAAVRRGGQRRRIGADELVPGDIVLLEQGEVVPADVRLVEARGLRVNEAALTGESVPAGKVVDVVDEANLPPADQRNMAFMGTAVTSGEAVAVVVATAAATEIGHISEQVEAATGGASPLELRINRLARWITVAIVAVAAIAFVVGLAIGRSVSDMLLLAVALSVSAIPAGLPVVVTVALAIGVHRMADRHALIRKLDAVDTLGSCTIIISDKTGTLTRNEMTVQAIVAGGERVDLDEGHDPPAFVADGEALDVDRHPTLREALVTAALCNDAALDDDGDTRGDPMEVALLVAASRAGLDRDELARQHPMVDKLPFRTEQRYMATVHDRPDQDAEKLVLVKGAPERVAELCDRRRTADGGVEPLDRDHFTAEYERLAGEGLRMLAFAVGGDDAATAVAQERDPEALVLVGLTALLDPPRSTALEAVDRCHEAGIRVVMVTGDHAATAAAIGRQVHVEQGDGSSPAVVTGQAMAELSDEELDDALATVNVFARVAPDQKLRIVERLKANDEVVAVTGDGVNDAPALQSAHLGVAMGSGTDVAKDASEMVVTDDDFASVYASVEEGRTAFRNIRMATFFLLSTGAAEVLLILTALVLDWPLPLLPAQILWLNVVTNGIQDVALAFEPGERALFGRRPRPKSEGILDRILLERLAIVAVWFAGATLGVFAWLWRFEDESLDVARTTTLTTFVLLQMVHVFNCRSEDVSVFRKPLGTNRVLLWGALASLVVHVGAMHLGPTQQLLRLEPMSAVAWGVALGVALTAIVVNEAHKWLRSTRPAEDGSPSGLARRHQG